MLRRSTNAKQYTNDLVTCSKTGYNLKSTFMKVLKQYFNTAELRWSLIIRMLALWGRGVNQNYSKCRNSAVNHHWDAITDRSLFACRHFIMNASHKSSLNDSSLNDSHSSDCLLSGGRSWIKPLTGNQAAGDASEGNKLRPQIITPPQSTSLRKPSEKQTDRQFLSISPNWPTQ